MKKFKTLTTLIGFAGKGQKTPEGVIFEYDERDPKIAALLQNKSIEVYTPPVEPKTVTMPQGSGGTEKKNYNQMNAEDLKAYAVELGIILTGEEKHADVKALVKAKLEEQA